MRLLRVLSSQHLPCGCLAGVYECFDGRVVGIVDERDDMCDDAQHRPGHAVPLNSPVSPGVFRVAATAGTPPTSASPTKSGNT